MIYVQRAFLEKAACVGKTRNETETKNRPTSPHESPVTSPTHTIKLGKERGTCVANEISLGQNIRMTLFCCREVKTSTLNVHCDRQTSTINADVNSLVLAMMSHQHYAY